MLLCRSGYAPSGVRPLGRFGRKPLRVRCLPSIGRPKEVRYRAGILFWYLVDPVRWQHAFHNFNTFIVPLAASLFLPWTTLMFVFVAPNGTIQPGGIFWIALCFVFDLLSYASSGYTNRDRFGVPPTTV